jgi:small nuclear ribonucleoprotein E
MEIGCKVEIWIDHNPGKKFQGIIRGFDEWMNLVLDQTEEIDVKKGNVQRLGRIVLKGDTISVVHLLRKEDMIK